MKNQALVAAINHVATERGLTPETVLETLEIALVSAYKRNYGATTGNIQATVDPVTGDIHVLAEMVVSEEILDDSLHISPAEARMINPDVEIGDSVTVDSTPDNFGRIAAQTFKQVMMQRIREAEREQTYERFAEREGEIVSGRVQRYIPHTGDVVMNIEQSEGVMSREDQLPNERYHRGNLVRAYLMEVKRGSRGTVLALSRTHRHMLRRLLEGQVPEIEKGIVEIKAIAREPGYRSKVAVVALQAGVEPVGCCVGMRGNRIQHIVDELNGEKIDVIAWSPDTRAFIRNALSPARPVAVILHETDGNRTAVVIVPDRQLSLSIGREGQNARLAAKLTGWRIDIKGESEAGAEGLLALAQQQIIAEEERKQNLLETVRGLLSGERDSVSSEAASAAEDEVKAEDAGEPDAEGAELSEMAAEDAAVEQPEAEADEGVVEVSEPEAVGEVDAVAIDESVPEQAQEGKEAVDEELLTAFEGSEAAGEGDEDDADKASRRKRDLEKRRTMVFDEELGRTITVRRRKRESDDWGDDDYL